MNAYWKEQSKQDEREADNNARGRITSRDGRTVFQSVKLRQGVACWDPLQPTFIVEVAPDLLVNSTPKNGVIHTFRIKQGL